MVTFVETNHSPRTWPQNDEEDPHWPQLSKNQTWKNAANVTKTLNLLGGGAPRRTRRPVSWRSFSEVSVAGVAAALDHRSPLLRRIIWTVVLVVCASLMLWQVLKYLPVKSNWQCDDDYGEQFQCRDRVNRYMEEPVNVNVRITHNNSLEFPAITVCNKNIFNRSAALELLVQHRILPASATDSQINISLLVGVNGLLPEQIWDLLAQRKEIFIVECWFGRGITCDERGKWRGVDTVVGPCYTYMTHETHVSNVGTFHNLFLRLQETTPVPRKDDSGVRVLVHKRRVSPVLAARTDSMFAELGWSRDVKMELRKFDTLNTASTPCDDDINYSEAHCQLTCFQQIFLETIRCRMPFMKEYRNLSECSTPHEYEEATNATTNMLIQGSWSVKDCNCKHECHQTAFQLYPENIVFKDNEIKLRIFYENLVYEQITEEKAYPTISLLCDIGGTLGLLMGASVLTVCELLEVAWSFFLRRCCRLKERVPPPTAQIDPRAVHTITKPYHSRTKTNKRVAASHKPV